MWNGPELDRTRKPQLVEEAMQPGVTVSQSLTAFGRPPAGGCNDKTSSVVVTGHKATFFEDINFGGARQTLEPGRYTLADLEAHGIPNDWISSFST